jgi:phosphate acetyltransferase
MTETPFHAENAFTAPLIAKLKKHPKRIVFPEPDDRRVLLVAQELASREISAPILLGKRDHLQKRAKKEGISLDMVGIIDPETSVELPRFAGWFEKMERYRKMKVTHPEEVMKRPDYFGAMMVQYGAADGIVGGNCVYPEAFFRPLFHMIRPQSHCSSVASCMAVVDENNPVLGGAGILFLADCAIIPEPNVEQLAMIAVESGRLATTLLDRQARVAMLSYSTRGSAKTAHSEKVVAAVAAARKRARDEAVDIEIDGEFQVDVALNATSAERKGVHSLVAGKADVLVFPDLNSANIASKLLVMGANPQAYGQLLLGLARPAAQVSRVATPETIFGTSVAVGVEAIKYRELIADEHQS